jgi:hypothetical protein
MMVVTVSMVVVALAVVVAVAVVGAVVLAVVVAVLQLVVGWLVFSFSAWHCFRLCCGVSVHSFCHWEVFGP